MAYNNLSIQDVEKIRIITISREEHLNALNAETINELHQAIQELEKDQAIRVGVLTGAGDKAFVAGADIKAFTDYNTEEGEFLAREGQRLVFDAIHHASKPFIAAI